MSSSHKPAIRHLDEIARLATPFLFPKGGRFTVRADRNVRIVEAFAPSGDAGNGELLVVGEGSCLDKALENFRHRLASCAPGAAGAVTRGLDSCRAYPLIGGFGRTRDLLDLLVAEGGVLAVEPDTAGIGEWNGASVYANLVQLVSVPPKLATPFRTLLRWRGPSRVTARAALASLLEPEGALRPTVYGVADEESPDEGAASPARAEAPASAGAAPFRQPELFGGELVACRP